MSQPDPPLFPSLPAHADAALLFVEGGLLWIKREGAGHTSGAGTRVKALGPQQLRAAVSEVPVDSGWLPEGVKRWGHGPGGAYALIVAPPQTRTLVLQRPGQSRPAVLSRLDTLDVSLPALAMLGIQRDFYVWALAGAPEPGSRLFYPPLPNVHDDGAVCWGENHPPRTATPKGVIKALELFLASAFTNAEVDRRSRSHPHDVRAQLLALAGAAFPTDDLVPFRRGETLMKAADRLTRRTDHDSRFFN